MNLYNNHEAGSATDKLIAEIVFRHHVERVSREFIGDKCVNEKYAEYIHGMSEPLREYSTEISAAFEVVKILEAHPDEILFSCTRKGHYRGTYYWQVRFRKCRGDQSEYVDEAQTLPLAICRVALHLLLRDEETRL